MRTQEEMATMLRSRDARLFLDFFPECVVPYMDYTHAREFLTDEAKVKYDNGDDAWKTEPLTREAVEAEIRDYMEFAWEKAVNERGLSAGRSVQKMEAWLWLIGLEGEVDWKDYAPYGKPILRRICELMKIELPEFAQ